MTRFFKEFGHLVALVGSLFLGLSVSTEMSFYLPALIFIIGLSIMGLAYWAERRRSRISQAT